MFSLKQENTMKMLIKANSNHMPKEWVVGWLVNTPATGKVIITNAQGDVLFHDTIAALESCLNSGSIKFDN